MASIEFTTVSASATRRTQVLLYYVCGIPVKGIQGPCQFGSCWRSLTFDISRSCDRPGADQTGDARSQISSVLLGMPEYELVSWALQLLHGIGGCKDTVHGS
jgi:hypothetical protein